MGKFHTSINCVYERADFEVLDVFIKLTDSEPLSKKMLIFLF
jgi:hypothetical protein